MERKPKITVITVVYNGEKNIARTIQSIINQTVSPYEYIIVDGCSTDKTLDIAERYRNQVESKGVIYNINSEKDKGIYDAMNKGVQLASGDYIAFLNADDWYFDDAIEIVCKKYADDIFELGYGSIQYVDNEKPILVKKSRLDKFVSSRNWNHPSTFVKKELYTKYPFDIRYKAYADFSWFLKMRKLHVKIAIFPADKPIAHFSLGGASMNNNLSFALNRAREKYQAYRENRYSRIYFFESYVWEIAKVIFATLFGGSNCKKSSGGGT